MIKKSLLTPSQLDAESILKDARCELALPSRPLFSKRALTLGGLSLLTGCNITDQASGNQMMERISRMNHGVQAWLFDPKRLAPTYTQAEMTRPFPFNPFYGIDEVPEIDGSDYQLEITGLVDWSPTSVRGRWNNCTSCRKTNKSLTIFASKVGAPSAVGAVCRFPIS